MGCPLASDKTYLRIFSRHGRFLRCQHMLKPQVATRLMSSGHPQRDPKPFSGPARPSPLPLAAAARYSKNGQLKWIPTGANMAVQILGLTNDLVD